MRSAARLARFSFNESVRGEKLSAKLQQIKQQVEEIKRRVNDDYRTIPQPDHGVMLADLKTLLGELNVMSEFWDNAESELDEIRECGHCDLCEDHQ